MLKYLIPIIGPGEFRPTFRAALLGGLIAGIYGIIHDQFTYSISPEYFTNVKFHQFNYANFGLGNRVFASTIGFLATWWVGFFAAWFLARRFIPNQPRNTAHRQIAAGIFCVMVCGITCGLIGFGYGLWRGPDADYSGWNWAVRFLNVTDLWSFVRVAYIHNAGYFGGALGLILALVFIRPNKTTAEQGNG